MITKILLFCISAIVVGAVFVVSSPARRLLALATSNFKSRQIIHIPALQSSDDGTASLAMALAYHGISVDIITLRPLVNDPNGYSNAARLLDAARQFGLKGRGVFVTSDQLDWLDPGSILHFSQTRRDVPLKPDSVLAPTNDGTFVVLEEVSTQFVIVVEPVAGRRQFRRSEFLHFFTGVALLFEPQ